jgi:hypothetical protein
VALNFPSSPTIGDVYTDTTSGFSYEWDGTVWKSYTPASVGNISTLDDISGSFNGVDFIFALTSNSNAITPINSQSLIINLGGVIQDPSDDYSVSGSNIIFSTPPTEGLTFSGVLLSSAIPITYANDGNIYIRNTYVGAGATGPFAFLGGYTIGYLDVYRNGVRLSSGTDFVGTSGTNFFLTEAAEVDDEIEAIGYRVTALVQASSNLDNLNVIGITTTGRLQISTNANVVGIVTAASFVGPLTGTASTATAAATAYGLEGIPNLNVGVVTATSFVGDLTGNADTATYAATAGIATYASTAGIATNLLGGNAGINTTSTPTNLYVSGNAAGSVVGLGTTDANTALDFSTGNNFSLTLTGSIVLSDPIGVTTGQSGIILIQQDGVGSHTVGFGSHWDFPSATAPTLSTGANALDALTYFVRNSTSIITNSLIGIGTL